MKVINSDFFPQSILLVSLFSPVGRKADDKVVESINSGSAFPGSLLENYWGFITILKRAVKDVICRDVISLLSITYSNSDYQQESLLLSILSNGSGAQSVSCMANFSVFDGFHRLTETQQTGGRPGEGAGGGWSGGLGAADANGYTGWTGSRSSVQPREMESASRDGPQWKRV